MNLLLSSLGVYLAIGAVFALGFVTLGVSRIDHAAKGAPVGFRLLIFPGATALWPWLLLRWIRRAEAGHWPREATRAVARLRRAHALIWMFLGPLLLAGLILALLLRPGGLA